MLPVAAVGPFRHARLMPTAAEYDRAATEFVQQASGYETQAENLTRWKSTILETNVGPFTAPVEESLGRGVTQPVEAAVDLRRLATECSVRAEICRGYAAELGRWTSMVLIVTDPAEIPPRPVRPVHRLST